MGTRQKYLAAGAAGALALLLILLLVLGIFPGLSDTATPAVAGPAPQCATSVHYFTEDVGSSHFFGPAVTENTVAGQLEELSRRRCQDPALAVAHAYGENVDGYGSLTAAQLTAKANELAANKSEWTKLLSDLRANETGATATDATMCGSYQTLYMVSQGNSAPLIRHWSTDRPCFGVLRLTWPDGHSFDMKLGCGFQNVSKTFPGIPALPSPSPQPQPQPTTTTTQPSPTCPPGEHPSPLNGTCIVPKNPAAGPMQNPAVPPVVKGPGTTPPGASPGPATPPCDTSTGYCPGQQPTQPVSSGSSGSSGSTGLGDSGPGATNTLPPSSTPTTTAPPVTVPVTSPPTTAPGSQPGTNCGNPGQPACGGGVVSH